MKSKIRVYESILEEHLNSHRQMAFVSGPRQVGKTTCCRALASNYLNWDNLDHRDQILAGPKSVMEKWLPSPKLGAKVPVLLFDELRKFPRWKELLKGVFDTYPDDVQILVTGSSRLDTYHKVGDSLMGRYFLYHMHPFTVAETITQEIPDQNKIVRSPKRPKPAEWLALWQHGGFPEPFLKRDARFSRRWQSLRTQQLLREDVRELTQIQQLDQLEMLVRLLAVRSGHQIVYSSLAKDVRVSVDTIRRWLSTLSGLHHGFLIKPWFKNVSRSLRKEPKWFLRDWANITDVGDRAETFIACHLLKAVEGWTDLGFGEFQLCYLRDKSQREVDFVVVRDGLPWFLVEVKTKDDSISPSLRHFQEQLDAPYAFQVVLEEKFVDADCLAKPRAPIVVPARTLLSQLI